MSFRALVDPVQSQYKEKGSRFLAFGFPVTSEEEVTLELEDLRKVYHDARHFCYGYVLGMDQQSWRANDDGEPGHSAGDPILGQIRSFGLTNTLVVVVRYFGGTKLGVPGLINAYRTAAREALEAAKWMEIYPKVSLQIIYSYEETNLVERWIEQFQPEIQKRDFLEKCSLIVHLRKSDQEKAEAYLIENTLTYELFTEN